MPAAAVPIIGAVGSLAGGLIGSKASNKAGEIQAAAAAREAQAMRDLLAQYNPPIQTAAEQAQEEVRGATAAGQAGVTGALGDIRGLLTPYIGAGEESLGTLRELMAPGGELARTPTAREVLAQDPGYQFRMDEATKALQASAAAKGGALGGGALRAVNNLVQNVASSEYGSAFERLRQQQADRYNRLSGLMGAGLGAAGTLGQAGLGAAQYAGGLGMQGAQYAGTAGMRARETQAANALDTQRAIADLMTSAAAAQAGGVVGGANAWQGALGGIGSAAQGIGRYYQDREILDLLRNPAVGIA